MILPLIFASLLSLGFCLPVDKIDTGHQVAHIEPQQDLSKIAVRDVTTRIPEEEKPDQVPIYGQSPDASDLGVPVDHIPVQESIVKSLIVEHDDVKIDLPHLIHSGYHRGDQVLTPNKPSDSDKVQLKLYTSFAADKETASVKKDGPKPDSENDVPVVGRKQPDDQAKVHERPLSLSGETKDLKRKITDQSVADHVQHSPEYWLYSAPLASSSSSEPTTVASSIDQAKTPSSRLLESHQNASHETVTEIGQSVRVTTFSPVALESVKGKTEQVSKLESHPKYSIDWERKTEQIIGDKIQIKEEARTEAASSPVELASSSAVHASDGNSVRQEASSKDISELLSDPVDQATKLLMDLEEQVQLYLKSEKREELATITSTPLIYGVDSESESVDSKQGLTQMQSMIDEVNRVAQNVESVISDLVSNRRYMTAAMFRSLLNYLRRVRISLERLQNRMQVLGVPGVAAATGSSPAPGSESVSSSSPSSTITSTYLDQIRDRIFRITEEIRTLIARMRINTASSSPSPSQVR